MHLKTLTVKGFKSFAGSTTFRLEPGMTCVVGPNGSGKSNVVDAIAWVLGEQGAKALRGGQMSDVIFAGTPDRPPLGRAEVTLTIDNSDGALAVDYTEVSISRLLYRSGDSEYAINGTPCRLLDVQELMSDSGIGRELHVIVGQGQLDAVLQARPEDRRAFIEEAAGVLKHRKRKEKSLRKLEAMAANVARLSDLTTELRRQLGPLGRQAEVARRAGAIQAALRDARLRLLADDLAAACAHIAGDDAGEAQALARRGQAEAELAAVRDRELQLEAAVAAATPAAAAAAETFYRLAGLLERTRGLASLAGERARHLSAPTEPRAGRDPEELRSEAAGVRDRLRQTQQELAADAERLGLVSQERARAEAELAAAERATVAAARAAADRREGLARLAGQLAAARSAAAAADQEIGRLAAALDAAASRADTATEALLRLQDSAGDLDAGEHGLDAAYERAAAGVAELDGRMEQLAATERAAAQEQAAARARHEALSLALHRRDGVGALLAAGLPGVLGPVAALLSVQAGAEAAVAAALGAQADAVAVADPGVARTALDRLKAEDAGRAGLLVAAAGQPAAGQPAAEPAAAGAGVAGAAAAPPLGRWASDLVTAPDGLREAVAAALGGAVVVDDLDAAARLVAADPALRAVTLDGDLLGARWATGGSATAPSQLEVQATADEAAESAAAAGLRAQTAHAQLSACAAEREQADQELQRALEALHASDARMAAAGEQLGLLAAAARSAGAEADRLRSQRQEAEVAREAGLTAVAELGERLTRAEAAPEDAPPPEPEQIGALGVSVAGIRAAEVDVRLAVRTGEERVRAETARAEGLERAAAAELEARERLAAQAGRRERGAAVAGAVAGAAARVVEVVDAALSEAAAARDTAAGGRAAAEGELLGIRERARALAAELDDLRDAVHRVELARAEQRMRVEALQSRALEEFGVGPEELAAEFGPDREVPPDADAGDDAVPTAYDRAVQTRRAAAADRQLAQLGRINPLALEEFVALEERQAFLSAQLEDLKATRRDLLGIVREVDEHIQDVFKAAYDDTAREFETVFATLFPGGSGHLELTAPDDLVTTGIEVVARPAGKKVSRLSLLSGGERSLAAIALLVAIFRARPSPFYVLDEVEAALDDVNLRRLLECLEDLRTKSQLIIITHQKRTMEVADALYGVSMRGDGVSAVVSQRLREPLTA